MAPRRRQNGAALLLGLLLLALLSAMVTSAFSENRWQRRIATHELAETRSLEAAGSALAWGEAWLLSRPGDTPPLACAAPCPPGAEILGPTLPGDELERQDEQWWLDHAHADGYDPDTDRLVVQRGPSRTPGGRWLVVEAHREAGAEEGPDVIFYRVYARAARSEGGPAVVLESVLARPWGEPSWSDDLSGATVRFCLEPGAPEPCGRLAWQRRR